MYFQVLPPSTTYIWKQKKKEKRVLKKGDSFFPHRITSDTHLSWAVKEGVPGLTLQFCLCGSLSSSMLERWCWWKHRSKGGLKYRVWCCSCLSGCYPGSGPRHQSLLRKSELGLPAAGMVHSCAQLAWAARPNEGKGAAISVLPYRKGRAWIEQSLRHGLHQQKRGRDQELEIAPILLGLSGSWCTGVLYLTLKAETRVICTFLPSSSFPMRTESDFLGVIFG